MSPIIEAFILFCIPIIVFILVLLLFFVTRYHIYKSENNKFKIEYREEKLNSRIH